MDSHLILWAVVTVSGFLGSALFSGMETGAYRLNRVRLYVKSSQGKSSARSLEKVIAKPASLIGTLLIGNNLCNYAGTAGLGVLLATMNLSVIEAVLINTVLVTFVLFVFGETLPKDLFAAHADDLMYPLAKMLVLLRGLFTWTGILPIVVVISTLAIKIIGNHGGGALTPRKRVEQMVREGAGVGLISNEQTAIAQRALELSNRKVIDECTPWAKVVTVRKTTSRSGIRALAKQTPRSRLPVIDAQGKVIGVADLIDTLLIDETNVTPAAAAMQPAVKLPADTSVRQALARMQREHIGLAIVVRTDGKPAGIVTVKDLVEPLTGELEHW